MKQSSVAETAQNWSVYLSWHHHTARSQNLRPRDKLTENWRNIQAYLNLNSIPKHIPKFEARVGSFLVTIEGTNSAMKPSGVRAWSPSNHGFVGDETTDLGDDEGLYYSDGLVGGLEHGFYLIFPYIGNNHPNSQLTHIFQRVETTNQWVSVRILSGCIPKKHLLNRYTDSCLIHMFNHILPKYQPIPNCILKQYKS